MSLKVVPIAPGPTHADAIELVEGLLARIKSGEVVAVGLVEVLRDGGVATVWTEGPHHHPLASGAARLSARMAMVE